MKKKFVIKNLNNNGYYKGRTFIDWSSEIDYAAKFDNEGFIKDEINFHKGNFTFDIFEGTTIQIIEVIEVFDIDEIIEENKKFDSIMKGKIENLKKELGT